MYTYWVITNHNKSHSNPIASCTHTHLIKYTHVLFESYYFLFTVGLVYQTYSETCLQDNNAQSWPQQFRTRNYMLPRSDKIACANKHYLLQDQLQVSLSFLGTGTSPMNTPLPLSSGLMRDNCSVVMKQSIQYQNFLTEYIPLQLLDGQNFINH